MDFYPRPPRGGRRPKFQARSPGFSISIHALREEGDTRRTDGDAPARYFYPRPPRGGRLFANLGEQAILKFLSTPSARRATLCKSGRTSYPQISIHALREEGDLLLSADSAVLTYFYPRPPRGGRRAMSYNSAEATRFLSTPSARRATVMRIIAAWSTLFLSTPSARRATRLRSALPLPFLYFYPRPPRGGRLTCARVHDNVKYFYPRPPRGGRPRQLALRRQLQNFYPRPPRGGRQQKQRQNLYFQTNYTTFCTNLEEP